MRKITIHCFKKCAKCGATSVQDGISSFHRFPRPGKNNIERMRAWAKFCWPEHDWSEDSLKQLHRSNKELCKRHFSSRCFTDNTNKRLGKFSVPTVADEILTNTICLIGQNDQDQQCTLYKIGRQIFKGIHKLRNRLKSNKKCDRIQILCEDRNVEILYNMKLSNNFIIFIQNHMHNCKRPGPRQYSIDQKVMALTLYQRSPARYRLLRRMFALPCQSSLKMLFNGVPLNEGINEHVFKILKKMAGRQLSQDNLCILSFDEMPIKNHVDYVDIVEGCEGHGNNQRINQDASGALVFMLAGIKKKWKQPIAYFFFEMSITARRLSNVIKEILHECWKTGLIVVATVCDLSKVNIKALDILGSSLKEPYFVHEGNEIVTILNPPHLLKCTRNLFINHDIKISTNQSFDGKAFRGVAKWCHLLQFFELDKNNPKYIFAPALTEQHLNPSTRQKKKVTHAAQIFSHIVAVGLIAKISANELPAEAQATAILLKNFDSLYDALNADGRTRRRGKMYSTNITKRSQHKTLFRDMKKYISEMIFLGLDSFPRAQLGWIRTINAVERLWENVQPLGLRTLSTRRLNKDPLENCIGCIKHYSGSNHPNTERFISSLKTAIISNMPYSSSKTNCEDDSAILSHNFKRFLTSSENFSSKLCDSVGIDASTIPQHQPNTYG